MTFALAVCHFDPPCEWEINVDADTVTRRELVHLQHAHGIVPPQQEINPADVVNPAQWLAAAVTAARAKVAAGERFTLYDLGLPDPPNAKTALGQLAQRIHDLQVAHPCDYTKSSRPGTRGSAVAVWDGNPARCVDKCWQRRRSA